MQHPKGPGCQPPVALPSRDGQYLVFQKLAQNWALITFIDARYSYSQLEIFQLVKADVDGIAEVISKKEEGRRICYSQLVGAHIEAIWNLACDLPNLRLLIKAYAFLRADVFHLGSSKLFASSFSVAACSRFQVAIRHKPCNTAFFFRAK
jgi:hypothetical protein